MVIEPAAARRRVGALYQSCSHRVRLLFADIAKSIDGTHGQLTRMAAQAGYDSLDEFTEALRQGRLTNPAKDAK